MKVLKKVGGLALKALYELGRGLVSLLRRLGQFAAVAFMLAAIAIILDTMFNDDDEEDDELAQP
ncbi:MAG TPA: hypothetical protein QGF35_07480 [Dehalococcoidia bacterium]|nr:hypothetical protein [Dehalococcoidia bacterium]